MKPSVSDNDNSEISGKSMQLVAGGKKDPSVRRRELLLDSGLAEVMSWIFLHACNIPNLKLTVHADTLPLEGGRELNFVPL